MVRIIFNKEIKFKVVLVWFFRVLLIGAIIVDIIILNWLSLFIAILALITTFIPNLLSDKNILYIPSDIQVIIIVFIFASLYLGELRNFYYRFWWWDNMLHAFSGTILGFIGFTLIYFLNREEEIDIVLSPIFVALFAFTFAVSIGVVWEIFEFTMDSLFAFNMQKTGLVDTMWDLIADCIGSGIASYYGYKYLKKGQPTYFEDLLKKVLSENDQFFN
ncbi:MAG: hypothetical protein R6V14_07480 [Halanaerobiales bacterium]